MNNEFLDSYINEKYFDFLIYQVEPKTDSQNQIDHQKTNLQYCVIDFVHKILVCSRLNGEEGIKKPYLAYEITKVNGYSVFVNDAAKGHLETWVTVNVFNPKSIAFDNFSSLRPLAKIAIPRFDETLFTPN